MRRANRIEPVITGSDAEDLARATVTTTTQMEVVRRVQVVPMKEALAQLHTDLNQSLAGDVIISPRIWTGMQNTVAPVVVRGSHKTLWIIGSLFIIVGLCALAAMITGLAIAFGNTNAVGESQIERYDIGDLNYGMDGANNDNFPSDTYLSTENKDSVQKYLSDQLMNESGYRGLLIDGVLVQQDSTSGRKRRATSCPTTFIVRNIQVYFDRCSTCVGSRNLALRRTLGNLAAFQKSLNLSTSNANASQISTEICSTPNITSLIVPVTLSILQAQQINSSLLATNTLVTATVAASSYSIYTYSKRPTTRLTYAFTSRSISTEKLKATTTSTLHPIETTSPIATTILNDISTVVSTLSSQIPTDSMSTIEFTIAETSTKIPEISTAFNELTSTVFTEIDETTSSIDLLTTSEILEHTTTGQQVEDTTTVEFEDTSTTEQISDVTTTEQFEDTTTVQFKDTSSTEQISDVSTTEQFEDTTTTVQFEDTTTAGQFEDTTTVQFKDTSITEQISDVTITQQFEDTTTVQFKDISTTEQISDVTTTEQFEDTTTTVQFVLMLTYSEMH
ncbi:unnamed protein product [Rotaria sp. Silwood2]|nr:unnamed protein product [Rotaria sp. Silwood2]